MNCIKLWMCTEVVLILTMVSALAAKVSDVKFDQQGIQQLQTEQLRFNIQLRPGVDFKQEILDEDIKRLFNTGNFADAVAEVKNLPNDQVEIIFKLRLKPRITKVLFQGNEKFSTVELAKEISVIDGALLKDRELRESMQNLRKFYADKGFLQAEITPIIENDGQDLVKITFRIAEHLKHKVNDVNFEGATVFSQWDLRHSIFNQYSYFNLIPFLNDYLNRGLLNKHELEIDKARLRDKYHNAGYLDFRIESVNLNPEQDDPEYINLDFKIYEGNPYKIGKISVSGNTVFSAEKLLPLIQLSAEEVFSLTLEQKSIRNIISYYNVLGYSDVTVRPVHSEDYENHLVDIDFMVTEGRKYTVRDTPVIGNTDTKTKVILREMVIQPGDPVDHNRIEASKQRLMGMGYFEKVEITAVNADALNEKDVQIRVQEKERHYNFRIGAGASDINNLFGMAEFYVDNFDLFNPSNWFYGGGQRLRLRGIAGLDNSGFNIDFVEPWLFDLPVRFELSGYLNTNEYDNWVEDRIGVQTSLSHRIFDDFTNISLGYKFEYVDINQIRHRLKSYMRQNGLEGGQFVSLPSLSISRDTRDNLLNPTNGYHLNFNSSVSLKALGSSNNYYRLEGKGSYYCSFFDKAIVAMIGAKIGTVDSFNHDNVPIFERYFMGGSDSIRGFEYRSVSPKYNKESVGGQTMLLLTTEVSHPIWGPIRGAAFVDMGNSWRNSYCMDFSKINISIGYGLRIPLPGINAPVRLDLAYPIVNNVDHEPNRLRFHFNLGVGYSF